MTLPFSTSAALCIAGDDLDPDEITGLLGAKPNKQGRKGEPRPSKNPDRQIPYRTGIWIIRSGFCESTGLDDQIQNILRDLTNDLESWHSIADRFRAEIFCGINMKSPNDMFGLSVQTLNLLSERKLRLELDVYDAIENDSKNLE